MQEAFAALVLEAGCDTYGWIAALKDTDRQRYDRICHALREDGAYVEVVEPTDILVTQRLWAEPNALAVLDYAFYRRHSSNLIGSLIEQAEPSFEGISAGTYPASRPLYLYVNADSARRRAGVSRFIEQALGEYTIARFARKGVIAPDEAERHAILSDAMQLKELNL
jgi:phosphate transport system substrate-binding protein